MAALGGRSPYEVVTGLVPRKPRFLEHYGKVEFVPINDYVKGLVDHLTEVYKQVAACEAMRHEREEGKATGYMSMELGKGDLVGVKRRPRTIQKVKRQAASEKGLEGGMPMGPKRFQSRTYPGVYRIKKKIDRNTFEIEDPDDPEREFNFRNKFHAERLIKLDMPEILLEPGSPTRIEIRDPRTNKWRKATIDKFAVDGRVHIVYDDRKASGPVRVDLQNLDYRYIQPTPDDADAGVTDTEA